MKKIIIILIISAFLGLAVFLAYPNKFIDTIRFFPNYNPFAKDIGQSISNIVPGDLSMVLIDSALEKTQLAMNNGDRRNVIVYLPKGYNAKNKNRIYPSFYLLHGSPGRETDWLTAGKAKESLDSAIEKKIIPPTVAVFPDGNGGDTRDTQYINSADGKELNEDFICKTVVDYVDNNFLTIEDPKFRAIGGLSSGAYGAINLGLKHQDVFGLVVSLSGYGYIDNNILSNQLIQGSKQAVFDNSPLDYIDNLPVNSTKILLIVGRQDGIFSDNKLMDEKLAAKKFDVALMIFDGRHTWQFWSSHLPDGIAWLGKNWK
jgi:enterochelin esterase-like enzyme